jgi:hypothetical protein
MDELPELVFRTVAIGVGATAVMDLWAQTLRGALGVKPLDYRMLGRWVGHLQEGTLTHDHIADAAPVRHEKTIGWCSHYLIGVAFGVVLIAMVGIDWARSPTLLPALAVGVVTVAAPWLILQPGLGAGIAATRTPRPNIARLQSLAAHTAYGIGLYAAARISATLVPA